MRRVRPDLIVNAAVYRDVDAAEREREAAFRVNALGARWLALAAEEVGAGIVYLSTDYVFSGDGDAPYHEWYPPRPLSYYGESKLAGEQETLRHAPRAWIVRTSWVYGGEGRTFVSAILDRARSGQPLDVVDDEVGGPTYARDLAGAIRRLAELDAPGVYHLPNEGECSRWAWARTIVELAGLESEVRPVSTAAYLAGKVNVARRPAHSTLANTAAATLGVTLRPWRDALAEYLCAPR